ncbi:MAG TPA: ABC transporter permease [Bryobacteraceae bacterium]|nr:ABC transporter permease [Bryobacteraceae bacterium]
MRETGTTLANQAWLRQIWAFIYRDHQLTKRYWSWVVVFSVYALVNSASVALIGVAAHDRRLTLTLTIGVAMWSFLSVIFNEISMSIAFERWEGTLEYTFMAPVSRLIHLAGVSIYASFYSLARLVVVLLGLLLFIDLDFRGANLPGIFVVLLVSSLACIGLGLIAAILPLMSPERGAEATNIVQGILLLVSGIYYPVSVLPKWVQPLSVVSPATYALRACRRLLGVETAQPGKILAGCSLFDVRWELIILVAMGAVFIPAGLWIFGRVEAWAKRSGKLKRTG